MKKQKQLEMCRQLRMRRHTNLDGEYGMKEMLTPWNKGAVAIWTARCASAQMMSIGDLYAMAHLVLILLMRNLKSPPSPMTPCCVTVRASHLTLPQWFRI